MSTPASTLEYPMQGFNPMAPAYNPEQSVTICSVFPLELKKKCNHLSMIPDKVNKGQVRLSMSAIYRLPAATRDSYELLRIFNTAQMVQNTINPQQYDQMPAPISARDLADSLVNGWALSTVERGEGDSDSIGVAIIAGPKPTDLELISLRNKQARFFARIIQRADVYWRNGDIGKITGLHKVALDWMGVTDREWGKAITRRPVKQCLACGSEILQSAEQCKECNVSLVQFCLSSLNLGSKTMDEIEMFDPYIANIVERVLKAQAAQEKEAQQKYQEQEAQLRKAEAKQSQASQAKGNG